MAFVDDDEVEEVRRILSKIRRWLAIFGRTTHERLKDREEQAAFFGYLAFFLNVTWVDTHHRVLGKSPGIGLDNCQLGVAKDQHVVSRQRLATPSKSFEPSLGNSVFAANATTVHDTSTSGRKRGVKVFGSSFGFVPRQLGKELLASDWTDTLQLIGNTIASVFERNGGL